MYVHTNKSAFCIVKRQRTVPGPHGFTDRITVRLFRDPLPIFVGVACEQVVGDECVGFRSRQLFSGKDCETGVGSGSMELLSCTFTYSRMYTVGISNEKSYMWHLIVKVLECNGKYIGGVLPK